MCEWRSIGVCPDGKNEFLTCSWPSFTPVVATRSCGAMDNASDYGSEDSRFESWQDRNFREGLIVTREFCFGRETIACLILLRSCRFDVFMFVQFLYDIVDNYLYSESSGYTP